MRRIAYCSPINPVHSGISDYSEELLPYMAQYVDITLYIDDGVVPANPFLATHLTIRPLSALAHDHEQQPYDAVLYHMGNSPAHFGIYDAAQRTPGVVVLHDLVLHHFMLQYHAVHRHDIDGYRALAAKYYGDNGTHIADRMLQGIFDDAVFDMPLCQPVLNGAQLLISHSQYVVEHSASIAPATAAAVVPMGVPVLPQTDATALRAQFDFGPDPFVIASFGHVNPYKRVEQVLRVVRNLRRAGVNAHYIIVGSVSPNFALAALVRRTGTAECVHVTGYVSAQDFGAYVAAADLCINLRHPTAGETSASLLRLLAAGKPTAISASGSFLEIPTDCAMHIPLDNSETDMLTACAFLVHQHPAFAKTIGAQARALIERTHTLSHSAARYMQVLARHYGWEEQTIQRPVLWDVVPVSAENGISRLPQPVLVPTSTPSAFAAAAAAHAKTTPWAESSLRNTIATLFRKNS